MQELNGPAMHSYVHENKIVLPPRRPDYNGDVERGNRTFREEFYNKNNLLANNITEMRMELEKALSNLNIFQFRKRISRICTFFRLYMKNHLQIQD
jgi:hypothetical protein